MERGPALVQPAQKRDGAELAPVKSGRRLPLTATRTLSNCTLCLHARSDTTWWWQGKSYFAQKEIRGDTPDDYTEEVERRLWAGIQETNKKIFTERNGVSIFLALTDDECHEVVRTSHDRFRTPLEHDVILPQAMKDAGVPYTPSWDKLSPLPGSVSCRLKAGEALIRK